jgi:hypothetical protein
LLDEKPEKSTVTDDRNSENCIATGGNTTTIDC